MAAAAPYMPDMTNLQVREYLEGGGRWVIVPVGSTVDILVDASNPGRWMLHCHIAEHLQAGMMMPFIVEAR